MTTTLTAIMLSTNSMILPSEYVYRVTSENSAGAAASDWVSTVTSQSGKLMDADIHHSSYNNKHVASALKLIPNV